MKTIEKKSGFTLIEILVVMVMISFLFLIGTFFDLTFYRTNSFGTDVDAFASVLQRARARAINNINAMSHGVRIENDRYVLFQGEAYGENPSLDEDIPRNPSLSFNVAEIKFSRLSGDSNIDKNVTVTGAGKMAGFYINHEGLINR